MKKIGVIGLGVVGGTVYKGLEYLGYEMLGYDQYKYQNRFNNVSINHIKAYADFIFLCLPTPDSDEGIDMSAFDEVMPQLTGYEGIIVIKSTVLPGTAEKYAEKYGSKNKCLTIVSNPEFLTEANAETDFFKCRIVAGGECACDVINLFEKLQVPKICLKTNKEAEMSKYMGNCFLAMKVVFANQMANLCDKWKIDYYEVLESVLLDERIGKTHFIINEEGGYGGMCFPKDVHALAQHSKFMKVIDEFNSGNINKKNGPKRNL